MPNIQIAGYDFVYVSSNYPIESLPIRSGIVLAQEISTGKYEVYSTSNIRNRIRDARNGMMGIYLRLKYGKDQVKDHVVFWHSGPAVDCARPMTIRLDLQSALGDKLLDRKIRHSRSTNFQVHKLTHPKSGQYMLIVRALDHGEFRPIQRYTELNRYRVARHRIDNKPLKAFCVEYGPFGDHNPLIHDVIATDVDSLQEAKRLAAIHARQVGLDKLLSRHIVPMNEWSHPLK